MTTDTLLVEHETADRTRRAPLIVAGLPRSGSSFLSEVISQIPGWYVFDDLYIHRKAMEIGASDELTEAQMDKLLFFMGWQIRARLRHGKYAIPNVAEEEVEPLNQALKSTFLDKKVNWAILQQEWMTRLARRRDCTDWGYKMPSAFRYLPELRKHYPNMQLIFLMRAPHEVLASYKFMAKGHQDGHPWQYHPIALAFYWRMAARSYLKAVDEQETLLVRFHDLVADPEDIARQIAGFLGQDAPQIVQKPAQPNSSFQKGKKRSLNGLELWLIEKITCKESAALGFENKRAAIGLFDVFDVLKTSVTFLLFRTGSVMRKLYERFLK